MSIEHADFDGIERLGAVLGGEICSTFDHPVRATYPLSPLGGVLHLRFAVFKDFMPRLFSLKKTAERFPHGRRLSSFWDCLDGGVAICKY